jgi:hypothetical protein
MMRAGQTPAGSGGAPSGSVAPAPPGARGAHVPSAWSSAAPAAEPLPSASVAFAADTVYVRTRPRHARLRKTSPPTSSEVGREGGRSVRPSA